MLFKVQVHKETRDMTDQQRFGHALRAVLSVWRKSDGTGTVTTAGYDQPEAQLMAYGDTHVYFKVPGHKYAFSAHPSYDGYGYSPVSHEVWEFEANPEIEGEDGKRQNIRGWAHRRLQW